MEQEPPVSNDDVNTRENEKLLSSHIREHERDDDTRGTLRDWEGFVHICKGNIGTGILGLPFAVKNAGLALGTTAIVFIAIIATHCMDIMVTSSQILSKKHNLSSCDYGGAAELSLRPYLRTKSRHARNVVNVFLFLTQLGFCSVYVLFMSVNLKQVAGQLDVKIWVLIITPAIIIFAFVRSLDILAYFSTLANLCMLVGLIIVYQHIFQHIPTDLHLSLVGSFSNVALAFGTIVYSFEGIGVVLPLENQMKKPENFRKVLWSGMVVVTICYLLMGLGGYLHYGRYSYGSITLNLPETKLYEAVRILFVIGIFLTYTLQFYVPISITFTRITEKYLTDASHCRIVTTELVYRSFLVIITGALAVAVPKLGFFIALIGALLSTSLALIFPPIIELATRHTYRRPVPKWLIVKDAVLVLFGIVGSVAGTIAAIYNLVLAFTNAHHTPIQNGTVIPTIVP